jgi:methionyl-tRNA formyltransferase
MGKVDMKVLVLSPYPDLITPALEAARDAYIINYEEWDPNIDWVICFGHRKIIGEPALSHFADRIINIHIAFLPWNRGADPNFWSWFDDTPKGITIHRIDEGIDTGNVIVQHLIRSWPQNSTLRSSHERLLTMGARLFAENWANIRRDGLPTRKQDMAYGSTHKKADKDRWFNELPLGWDTPVKYIRKLGKTYRDLLHDKKNRSPRPRKYRQATLPEL